MTGRLLAIAVLGLSIGAAPPVPMTLGPLTVQMFLSDTGRLSRNIAPPVHVDLWNIGAGSDAIGGSSNDALVVVTVGASGSTNSTAPLVLTARNARGVLGTYTYKPGDVYVSSADEKFRATLWLHGIQCAGRTTFTASYGAQRKQAVISFDCGE